MKTSLSTTFHLARETKLGTLSAINLIFMIDRQSSLTQLFKYKYKCKYTTFFFEVLYPTKECSSTGHPFIRES